MEIIKIDNLDTLSINNLLNIKSNLTQKEKNEVTNYLIQEGIIEDFESYIVIHHRKLRDLIDEQIIANKFYDYFASWHFCHW